jgi:hypothetical protein
VKVPKLRRQTFETAAIERYRGRKSWLFASSDRGGEQAAVMLTLIHTAKLKEVDPQAWLADVLARIADHEITGLAGLLPWNWRRSLSVDRAA